MKPLSSSDPVQIGPYRLIAELGRGAMGRVLLGAGPDGRLVAVKMIREWLVEDEEFRARFREEVRKSRQVSSHYTAAVDKAGPDDPIPWLASEFLRGPNLSTTIEATGPLPEAAVLRLAAGLASALASIHEAGVIHRDLKPGNVILEASGPRVIDFGIARAADLSDSGLTRTGGIIGTPGFMSPEQVRSETITAASDVFSLGSVLVMACTGTSPFVAASTLDTMNNVVRAEPDLTGVPETVRAIAARCLAPDPADRPSPDEVLELIGPVAPSSRPWPEAISALADEQHRELARLLGSAGEDPTLIDDGSTLVIDPNQPTWAVKPPTAPRPPVDRPVSPPPVPPTTSEPKRPPRPPTATGAPFPPRPQPPTPNRTGSSAVGVVAVLLCIGIVAAIAWDTWRQHDREQETDSDVYVQECQDDGYTQADCEASWPLDPSSTWTGQLYEGDGGTEGSSQSEVYVQECQDDGYSQADCEASWGNDSSYTWTGSLYPEEDETEEETEESGQYDVYVQECQDDGYSQADCEASWYSDTSYTWTGYLYEAETETEGSSQYDVYIQECQNDGYTQADCEASWPDDPSYTWTGYLY